MLFFFLIWSKDLVVLAIFLGWWFWYGHVLQCIFLIFNRSTIFAKCLGLYLVSPLSPVMSSKFVIRGWRIVSFYMTLALDDHWWDSCIISKVKKLFCFLKLVSVPWLEFSRAIYVDKSEMVHCLWVCDNITQVVASNDWFCLLVLWRMFLVIIFIVVELLELNSYESNLCPSCHLKIFLVAPGCICSAPGTLLHRMDLLYVYKCLPL